MYSVVLMMALSGGAESADFGQRKCHGGGGCAGSVAASCSGRAARSHGCHGSRGGLFGGRKCHGCSGAAVSTGCHGSRSTGCHGSRGGLFHRNKGCHGGGGCHGGPVCAGGPGCAGGVVVPGGMEPKVMPKEKVPTPPTKTSLPANIVVTLPADARLTVDGNATSSTSEVRTFVTPALQTGSDYVYTLQAEVVRDGRTLTETQVVTVRAGETTNVPFSFSSQSVASR
jgi:uncharacterized protein (TIGR03000 family)